jgi:alanine dehydrogenase
MEQPINPSSGMEALSRQTSLVPQEKMLEMKQGKKRLLLGIPKERAMQENRVALTPEAVALLVNNGHEVWVEKGAGDTAKYSDQEYGNAGAQIKYTSKEVFEADVVLKVEPPTEEEVSFMKPGKTVISALQLGNQKEEYIHRLNKKRITAVAFEFLEDKVGGMPVVRAMSEIAGSAVLLIAAEQLSSTSNGKGIILGGITGVPPTRVLILGAGTVGEYAARTALGMGAEVQVFDMHLYKLRRIRQSLGHHLYTSTLDPVTLANSLRSADVVIGAIRAEKGRNKTVVTEQMVMNMRPGSIIIDVSIDQGGCVETSEITTHGKPTFLKHDIIHYCVPNIPSRVARTATQAFSNIFSPILLQAADMGGIDEMIFSYKWFMNGVYTYKGFLSNQHVARKFGLKHKDLNLLMAARN